MFRLILRRIGEAVPTLFILIAITFFLVHSVPGSPFVSGKDYPPEVMHNLEAKYHLDKPLVNQLFYYLKDLAQGDFGPSYKYKDYSVNDLLRYALPVSMTLGTIAFLVALFVGVTLGMMAALKQNSFLDYFFMVFAMIGVVVPNFVLAPLMILIFSVLLHWLPSDDWQKGNYLSFVLPVLVLAVPHIASIGKLTRSSMIEILNSPFIRTARAKGLPKHIIIFRHALKPTLIPVFSYLGPALVGIMTGSVIIEQIFMIPGMGQLFVDGALNRDYGLVVSLTILVGFLSITFNTLIDISIGLLDPRVKY